MAPRFGHHALISEIELWVKSRSELLSYLESRINKGESTFIITLNPLMIMERDQNQKFREALESADVIVADGRGVKWAARKIGKTEVPLIPGVELAEDLIKIASEKNLPVAFIGSKEGVWEKARDNLRVKYPRLHVVAGHHGYFNEDEEIELIAKLASHNPLLLIVGMGSPRQEVFLCRNREKFPGAVMIGVGGSLDVYAGEVKRAPDFFRKIGMEWLWRMLSEPRRIKNLPKLIRFWLFVKFHGSWLLKGEK